MGCEVLITRSLARGGFGAYSDIDLLITRCPSHLKYAIEGMVEDALCGLPFDVIYADELPPLKLARFMDEAKHVAKIVDESGTQSGTPTVF